MGKVIPTFQTLADGTVNNLLESTYDLNELWGTIAKRNLNTFLTLRIEMRQIVH